MRLLWEEEGWGDYTYWQTQDRKTLKRVNQLITDIVRNGYKGRFRSLWWNYWGHLYILTYHLQMVTF